MRRAVVVLGTTAAGLAALFSYKTHVASIAVASTSPATPTVSAAPTTSSPTGLAASASPSTTATKKSTPQPSATTTAPTMTSPTTAQATKTPTAAPSTTAPTKKATTAPTTPAPTKSSTPAGPSGTFSGPTENTQYGEVQVTITVSDGKITNAEGNLPQGGDSIAQNAIPTLNQEVLTAQSASIQAVSGATYTSDGYIQSLQSAVDSAGL